MLRRSDLRPALAVPALIACVLLVVPAGAAAARLVGGRQQAAISRAFFRQHGSKGRVITSIRASSRSPSWSVARWVTPTRGGGSSTSQSNPRVHATYFHAVGGAQRPRRPPAKTARELGQSFRITVFYTGSGSENVNYAQSYRSVCSGGGGFVEQERDTVSPMSWRVRYTVNLDQIVSAVRGPQGVVVVPTVTFDHGSSSLNATEHISRSYVDQGCFNTPTNTTCVNRFRFSSGGGDQLGFRPGQGLEIGIPMKAAGQGKCSPSYYQLGPSLWDSGAATALVHALGLPGGTLPANPYRTLKLSWPVNSAGHHDDSVASPCQGIASGCTDRFSWKGSARLERAG
jgi:hypothetical protein